MDKNDKTAERIVKVMRTEKQLRARLARKTREDILKSLGLTKVRGALGGTYWE